MSEVRRVLALDVATATGWASYERPWPILSGCKSFATGRYGSHVDRLVAFESWIRSMVEGCSLVAHEQVRSPHKSTYAAEVYHGMTTLLRVACHHHGVRLFGYSPGEIKKLATGKGNAKKQQMIVAARAQWPDQWVLDDNQADALWVLYTAMKELKIAPPHYAELTFNA